MLDALTGFLITYLYYFTSYFHFLELFLKLLGEGFICNLIYFRLQVQIVSVKMLFKLSHMLL